MLKKIEPVIDYRAYIYSLVFALIIFLFPVESLSDRDAYINWILNIKETSSLSSFSSFRDTIWLISSEQVWNLLARILSIIDPGKAFIYLSCLISFMISLSVFRNTKGNNLILLLLLSNVFVLTACLNHIRSGIAMALVLTTFNYPKLDKSLKSRLIRLIALGIHNGSVVYIFLDYFDESIDKIRRNFGRSSMFLFGIATIVGYNLLFFLVFTKYIPNEGTILGRGSSIGLIFYLSLLLAIICCEKKERDDCYISILLLTMYCSCYYIYPPISRILEMGFPILIISIMNIESKNKKYILPWFLIGSIAQTAINFGTLYN